MATRPTVSILIIGDEILKGQTMDTNSHFLCQELYKSGVRVARVTVIPDDVDIVAEEVRSNSEKYSYVLTSGGVGPTHDDITYEGIAKAFNEKVVLNKDLQKIWLRLCLSHDLDEKGAFKMSHVPESSEIHPTYTPSKKASIPVISVRNVFAFPGIPTYLEFSFLQLKSLFSGNSVEYFSRTLYVDSNEFTITNVLNAAVKEFDGVVKFGSYPDVDNTYYQVKLTLEADSDESVLKAEAFLRSHLPHNSVVGRFPPKSEEALLLLQNIFVIKSESYDDDFANIVKSSLKVLEECYDEYPFQSICLSFNGGKDCTVLLHLTYLYLAKFYPERTEKLKVMYVRSKQPFSEIEDFIKLCVERYDLELITYNLSIKEALIQLQKDRPDIQAILLGTRSTDPHCSDLKSFQKTDNDWPQFMRVNPLITWSYQQVWKFLRTLEVPYCSLYDRGYTSVGCQHNTVPNEQLLSHTKEGQSYYLPAYLLKNPDQEREGRTASKI